MTKDEYIAYAKSLESNKDIPGDATVKFSVRYWDERDWDGGPLSQPMEAWGTESHSLCNPYTDPTEYYLGWWKCIPLKGGTFVEIPPDAKVNDDSLDPTARAVWRAILNEWPRSWKKYSRYSFKTREDMERFKESYVFNHPATEGK